MSGPDLISRLTELAVKTSGNTLALSPKHILDEQLNQELTMLTEKVQQQLGTGQISLKNSQAAMGLIAGLYLWNGNLDNSHTIAQDLENSTGSYLHGILHRMEPDYANAKYWFRMAGAHPAGDQLQQETLKLLQDSASGNEDFYQRFSLSKSWNPGLLTDIVEEALRKEKPAQETMLLEQIQALELHHLIAEIL